RSPVTIIEIRPFRNGWQVYEAPGVQPVFLSQGERLAPCEWGQRASHHCLPGTPGFVVRQVCLLQSVGNSSVTFLPRPQTANSANLGTYLQREPWDVFITRAVSSRLGGTLRQRSPGGFPHHGKGNDEIGSDYACAHHGDVF